MSTLSIGEMMLPAATVDDFSALESRVVRAVELVKTERAARAQGRRPGLLGGAVTLTIRTSARDRIGLLGRESRL